MSIRIPYQQLKDTIKQAFLKAGLSEDVAERCATVHADSSLDGVQSHGLNRVPRFIDYVKKGWVDPNAKPEKIGQKGAVENYDGHLGPGIVNAQICMARAIELAREHGIGCVALKNTTHWMRGGTYAWQAAHAGMIGICWTNTESSMPMWGSTEPGVGNNPFCFAIPREEGPIVLDMAMSQYAWGKIGTYRLAGKTLPYPGGFDRKGQLTCDPAAIEDTRRILPTGYWKGSGMAIVLDLAAAAIANGNSGSVLDDEDRGSCTGACQIFIAVDPYLFGGKKDIQTMFDQRVGHADGANPVDPAHPVTCPGEHTVQIREKNKAKGVAVNEQIWKQVCDLAQGASDSVKDISAM
jgi:3-dehydro-L-gulonate 2-dehydrogenase